MPKDKNEIFNSCIIIELEAIKYSEEYKYKASNNEIKFDE